jgi:hypothetical protein
VLEAQNLFAGQGPVLLDIGDDVGALIIEMPAELDGVEIEIRPVSGVAHSIANGHTHDGHSHPHSHDTGSLVHVAVLARPIGNHMVHSAVFPELTTGDYELYERLVGEVRLRASIRGGEVTNAVWPIEN